MSPKDRQPQRSNVKVDQAQTGEPADRPASANNDKYRNFIEKLPVLFYAVQAEPPYTPIYVSPGFEIFGYPLADWLKDPDIWLNVIHEDDRSRVFDETVESTRTGQNVQYEYRVIGADGRVFWVRDRGCLIRDEDGTVKHRQGVIVDITVSKLAEQEVEKREKQYRTLAKNIPATAVLLFDHDMRYTLADGELLKHHNYSQEMFENKTIWEVFPQEVSDEWSDYYRRALGGEHISFERNNPDGWFQVDVLPVRDENDEIFAGMVLWQDITERKRAVEDLLESEARYRNLFENANDIIYVHDLKGNYISMNDAAERVFGYSQDEALKMNMADIAAPEHYDIARRNLLKKLQGEAKQTAYEVDCIRKDGTRVTLEVNSTVIMKDGASRQRSRVSPAILPIASAQKRR